jgi:hypothetical protein
MADYSFDEEEDSDAYDPHYNFEKGYYDGLVPTQDMSLHPTFSYKYLDLGKTSFNFHLPEFDETDRKAYFKKLREYSQQSLDTLVNHSSHLEHFKLSSNVKNPEYGYLAELIGKELKPEIIPTLGHFALSNAKYVEGTRNKCPRIFFLLGIDSVIHILFYDPFHDIHPMADSTKASLKKT